MNVVEKKDAMELRAGGERSAQRRSRRISMRELHRWLSILVGVFILAIACSGLALQVEALAKGGWTLGPPPPPPTSGKTPESVDKRGGISAAPTAVVAPPPGPVPQNDLHILLLELHRGDFFGPFGTWISILSGVVLTILSITGLWVYIDMLRHRLRRGRRGLFWR